jgi:cytidylate kinase
MTMYFQHVAISGDLGSGKSSVSRILSKELGMRVFSTGEVQRSIAESMGLSSLEANVYAESEETIDARLDHQLEEMGRQEESVIFDSRLAWHFVPTAFKVHLVVDPHVAAERLFKARSSSVERYHSVEDALTRASARFESERRRFSSKYGIDIARLRNYDLVVDSSDVSAAMVAAEIIAVLRGEGPVEERLRISPRRVIPTGDCVSQLAHLNDNSNFVEAHNFERGSLGSPAIGYVRPYFFALRDHELLSKAIRSGAKFIPAKLEVEQDEEVAGGLSAEEYLRSEARRSWICDWEDVHGFHFKSYPEDAR